MIYLDWAATAPSFPKAGQEASTWHANPSSPHPYGRLALADLDSARARIAKTLHAAPDEIVFTSGATESNNLVLQSILTLLHPERRTPRRDTLVISAVEHDSVDGMATLLSRIGLRVLRVPVDKSGMLEVDRLHEILDERTYLVSVQTVNNETGIIQPISEAAKATANAGRKHSTRILFHTDAVQALKKVPLRLIPEVDAASFSAHKIGGPRGVGVLWVRTGTPINFMQAGGEQEDGRRAGTENVAGAVGFADSLSTFPQSKAEDVMSLLIQKLRTINGVNLIPNSRTPRDDRFSPFILKLSVTGLPSEVIVRLLGDQGICVSPGSACATNSQKRLRVLEAMQIDPEEAAGAIRVSIGPTTTADEVNTFASTLRTEIQDITGRITPSFRRGS